MVKENAIGDKAILFIRRLLQNDDWNVVISSQIEKCMKNYDRRLQADDLENLLLSLSIFVVTNDI